MNWPEKKMPTPNTTKEVEELKRKHPCIVTDKVAIGNQSELYTDIFDSFAEALTTLTQHHEAEVERAVRDADAEGAYHSGYLAGLAEKEKVVIYELKAIRSEISRGNGAEWLINKRLQELTPTKTDKQ